MSPQRVTDMLQPAITLPAHTTAAEARAALRQANAPYGVVVGEAGDPVATVTLTALDQPDVDPHRTLAQLPTHVVADPPVAAHTAEFDLVAYSSGRTLKREPHQPGVVIQNTDSGEILGLLPRQQVLQRAAELTVRKGGTPTASRVMWFACPLCHARRRVAYYDPHHPPRCRRCSVAMVRQED